jgi:uncharacterized membrane protein
MRKIMVMISSLRASGFFLFAGFVIGLMYCAVTPPMQVPDEVNHFYRVWQISEGDFLPVKQQQRVGGEIPSCVDEFLLPFRIAANNPEYRLSGSTILESFAVECDLTHRTFRDFPNTANYSALSYLPQLTGVMFAKLFTSSPAWIYLAGRTAVFATWLLSMYWLLRRLKEKRWLFTALLLLPMQLYISTSYSADAVTNILSFLLIGEVFVVSAAGSFISNRRLLYFLLLATALAFTKIIYVQLIFLMVLIPADVFGSIRRKVISVSAVVAISFIVAWAWSATIMQYYVPYQEYAVAYRDAATLSPGADYHSQLSLIKKEPAAALSLIRNSLTDDPAFYFSSYIGEFGPYMGIKLSLWIVWIAYALLIIAAVFEGRSRIDVFLKRLLLVCIAALVVSAIIISQHLTWNPVGKNVLEQLQGRYLIPVLPLILLAFSGIRSNLAIIPLVLLFVILTNAAGLSALYKRYVHSDFETAISFSCDFEQYSTDTLLTSDDVVRLGPVPAKSSSISRKGRFSAVLPPSACGAIYSFMDLQHGDLVDIDVWKRGHGGRLVVTGNGSGCEPYYFTNELVQFNDSKGWGRLNMSFSMPANCSTSKVFFYLDNPGNDTVYFDELKFLVRKRSGKTN